MNPRNRFLPPPAPKSSVLFFVKAGHHYAFRYPPGDEKALINALLDAASDPQLSFDFEDARKLIRAGELTVDN